MADRYGVALRRLLCCAESFKESAILCGSLDRKIFDCRSNALLCSVTCADQRLLLLRPRLALFDDRFACFAILPVVPCRDPVPALTNSSHATAIVGLNLKNWTRDQIAE